ncbi:MAG TPA: TolC family protein, partial [Prolixibacteraceae bacterium]|nr:TolC family protein [Prolixibacteraceae bacterium]
KYRTDFHQRKMKTEMKKVALLLITIAIFMQSQAQEKWSLQKCIDYALSNNIMIKQTELNTQYRSNQYQQSKNERLPDVNAGLSQGFNFGRSLNIDNTYDNFSSSNTGLSVNSSVQIWRGGALNNTIKQREFELKSSLEDLQKAKDDLTLNIASAYLEILFANELINASETQIEQTNKQIQRTKELVAAGKVAEGTLLEIEAQRANEELTLVTRQNQLQLAYLNLAQMLELEDYNNFSIEIPEMPELASQASIASSSGVYEKALQYRPEIKSADYTLKSYESQLKVAKSSLLPSLSASASFDDRYLLSSENKMPALSEQIKTNHSEGIGLYLNIPIFNKFENKTNIENAKIQVKNQQLQLESTKKELRKQIEQAYTNALASQKRFNANRVASKSMSESFRYIEEKYNVGRVSSVEYNDAKTKLAIAESNLIQAKYEFIFRSKILDFYNGIPISL